MPDNLQPDVRKRTMASVKGSNTGPEILIRSLLHRMGYRFRLHRAGLPGKPDIVLPKYRTVIFVNGCFWHQHHGCPKAKLPTANREYWQRKLSRNAMRDVAVTSDLSALGWRILVIWTCEIRKSTLADLGERLRAELSGHTVSMTEGGGSDFGTE